MGKGCLELTLTLCTDPPERSQIGRGPPDCILSASRRIILLTDVISGHWLCETCWLIYHNNEVKGFFFRRLHSELFVVGSSLSSQNHTENVLTQEAAMLLSHRHRIM